MLCPRCQQPTHVVASRAKGLIVKRSRQCGLIKNGKIVGQSCGYRFQSVEMPVGWSCDVTITMTPTGVDTHVKRKKSNG
jgi:transcriptional regulator NrdR family protein